MAGNEDYPVSGYATQRPKTDQFTETGESDPLRLKPFPSIV